jgi:hypothetical protein
MHVNITNLILASVAVLGVLGAVVAWVYNRGKEEQALKDALIEATAASKDLADSLKEFKGAVLVELREIKADVLDLKLWRASHDQKA